MEIASGVYAGHPLQIAHLMEDYLKRKTYQHVECWIVTTDLDLQPEEIREAAHLRWHIENNTFKRLSHHTGTKRFYFKDPNAFFALLRLLYTAIALLDILLHILRRNRGIFKSLLQGIKTTWKNVFSQLEQALKANIFA
jgi:IS4 transposase